MYNDNFIEIIINLIFPPVAAVVSLILALLFFYFSHRVKERYYFSSFLLCINSLFYSVCELLLRFDAILYNSYTHAYLYYTIKQLIITLFIITISYYFLTLKNFKKSFNKIYYGFIILGAVIFFLSILAVLTNSPYFLTFPVDTVGLHYRTLYQVPHYGIIFKMRNYSILLLIFVTIVFSVRAIYKRKRMIDNIVSIVGVIFLSLFAIVDIMRVNYDISMDTFFTISFPRTSIGLMIFLLINSFIIIKYFFEKAGLTEKTLIDLRESKRNLKMITRSVNEVVWITDFPPTRTIYINSIFKEIFNLELDEVYKDLNIWKSVVSAEDVHLLSNGLELSKIKHNCEFEYRINKHSKVLWIRDRIYPVRDTNGDIFRLIRVIEDISDKKQSEEQLSYLAFHDPLTGILNRKALYDTVSDALLQSRRGHHLSLKALLTIDLDEFKDINETAGHSIGDKLLCFVSDRLANSIRETDYLFRIGGDEFVIVLNHIEHEYASASVAEKIIDKMSKPFICNDEKLFLGVSIGIAIFPKDGIHVDDLVRNSDIALRDAKKSKNSFSFYNTEMNIRALNRVALEKDLRGALERNEFSLAYQPFVNQECEITGMEVLLRWNSEHGSVSPEHFIPIIENNGMIISVGKWILHEALGFLKELSEQGYVLRMAINISPRQFNDEQFIHIVQQAISRYGVDPKSLELEITEGLMINDPEAIARKMKTLAQSGVSFSIDDFGTGYSSLSYIKEFPISHLKIDRIFVTDLAADESNRKLTRAIVAMAHSLGLAVIGEGVEDSYQLKFLRSINCNEIQGFYYSKPLSRIEFIELLQIGIKNRDRDTQN